MNNFVAVLFSEKTILKIALSLVFLALLSQIAAAQNTYTTHTNLSYVG